MTEGRGQERRYHSDTSSLTSQSEGSASPQKSSPRCTFEQSQGLGCCLSPPFCQTVEGERQMMSGEKNSEREKQDNKILFNKQIQLVLLSPCTVSLFSLSLSQTLAYYTCIHINLQRPD